MFLLVHSNRSSCYEFVVYFVGSDHYGSFVCLHGFLRKRKGCGKSCLTYLCRLGLKKLKTMFYYVFTHLEYFVNLAMVILVDVIIICHLFRICSFVNDT